MKILGIDPGSRRMGWSCIGPMGATAGALEIREGTVAERLYALGMALSAVIGRVRPDVVVIEKAFVGANRFTSLVVAEARAVALFVAASWHLPIVGVANNTAKKALTGKGNATKERVILFATRAGKFARALSADEADAYALAFCHAARQGNNPAE